MSEVSVRNVICKCKYCGSSAGCRIQFEPTRFVCAECLFNNMAYTKEWIASCPPFLREHYEGKPKEES